MVKAYTAEAELEAKRVEVEALKMEVARKEAVIVAQIEKNKVCYRERDNLQGQVRNLEGIDNVQRETIAKLSKPKRFGIGMQTGYSLTGYYLGVGVSINIIRF